MTETNPMSLYRKKPPAGKTGGTVREDHCPAGIKPDAAALRKLLLYCLTGLAQVAEAGGRVGFTDRHIGSFTVKAAVWAFRDIDSDLHRIIELIQQTVVLREQFKKKGKTRGQSMNVPDGPAAFMPASTLNGLLQQAGHAEHDLYQGDDPGIVALKQTVLSEIKEMTACADHARKRGIVDESLYASVFKGLAALGQDGLDTEEWTALIRGCRKAVICATALRDKADTREKRS